MVDTIKELSDLSSKINQKSDQLNSIISKVNRKLSTFNLGLEVWLGAPLSSGPWRPIETSTGNTAWTHEVTQLGYCRVEDEWQVAIRHANPVHEEKDDYDSDEAGEDGLDEGLNAGPPHPLLKAARDTRIRAMSLLPRLLEELKAHTQETLGAIDKAEKLAESL